MSQAPAPCLPIPAAFPLARRSRLRWCDCRSPLLEYGEVCRRDAPAGAADQTRGHVRRAEFAGANPCEHFAGVDREQLGDLRGCEIVTAHRVTACRCVRYLTATPSHASSRCASAAAVRSPRVIAASSAANHAVGDSRHSSRFGGVGVFVPIVSIQVGGPTIRLVTLDQGRT